MACSLGCGRGLVGPRPGGESGVVVALAAVVVLFVGVVSGAAGVLLVVVALPGAFQVFPGQLVLGREVGGVLFGRADSCGPCLVGVVAEAVGQPHGGGAPVLADFG